MSNKKTNKATEATEQQPDVEQQYKDDAAPEQGSEQTTDLSEKEKPASKTGKTEKAATSAKTLTTATAAKEKPAKTGSGVLTAVGKAACKRHKLPQVWVTNDGQAFANENDAKAHAKNLPNSETIKVTA